MIKKTFQRPDPIPPFKTLDEEAEFYDTHDMSGFGKVPLSKLPLLEKEKESTLSLRIQKSMKKKLDAISRAKGIGSTTLARMWIIERINASV